MESRQPDTEILLARAAAGDDEARGRLLDLHRGRLRQMLAVRMDRRIAKRVDPSDLVQETLVDAHRRLDEYLAERPLPFYPWLRKIALDRVIDLHRRHVRTSKRAVTREAASGMRLPDGSAIELARRLAGPASGPSAAMRREDNRLRVRIALDRLAEGDREILVLRYLEEMTPPEIAAVLELSEPAVSKRHLRALERLRRLLGDEPGES